MPALAAPDVERDLGASYLLTALALLVAPPVLGLFLEAPLLVLADRRPRRWFVAGGIMAMGVCGLVAAFAPTLWVFAGALAFSGLASGVGLTIAEATLVDDRFDDVEAMMTRWMLLGVLGDLAAPAVFAGLIALGFGWRGAVAAVSIGAIVYGVALARREFPRPEESEDDEPAVSVWAALRNPWLMAWSFAEGLCDLLDETLVVFASLRLRDELGASPTEQSAVMACFVAGGVLGLLVLQRLVRRVSSPILLIASGAACTAFYVAWLHTSSLVVGGALFAFVGATAAPLWPLTTAMAYRMLPGASGTVNAVGYAYMPLAVGTPLLLGYVAEHHGVGAALAALVVEPVGIAVIAALYVGRGRGAVR